MARGGRDGDGAAERVADEIEAIRFEPPDQPVGDLVELEPLRMPLPTWSGRG